MEGLLPFAKYHGRPENASFALFPLQTTCLPPFLAVSAHQQRRLSFHRAGGCQESDSRARRYLENARKVTALLGKGQWAQYTHSEQLCVCVCVLLSFYWNRETLMFLKYTA